MMSQRIIVKFLSLFLSLGFVACSSDSKSDSENENPTVHNVIAKHYDISRLKILSIDPIAEGYEGGAFMWKMTNTSLKIEDSIISRNKRLDFLADKTGDYKITLYASANNKSDKFTTQITVKKETVEYSPYISVIYDYLPALGQFVNKLPKYAAGDTKADIIRKVGESIIGEETTMIHLGGFGGYVDFGFDHTIINVSGKRDLRVLGNAFWADANPNPNGSKRGGSCEPGIIMVAYDKNKNGKPDEDEWYEIAGSEYNNPKTIKDYQITFYRPNEKKKPVKDENFKWATDMEYAFWKDNQGNEGYKSKNMYHAQSYFPQWIKEDEITFKGTLLPNNAVDESGQGNYWVLYSLPYGYADNAPNDDDESAIDIDWAVDRFGNKVHLPGIDFVRVYNGTNQEAGWLGETSTEVSGAYDLHMMGESIKTRVN